MYILRYMRIFHLTYGPMGPWFHGPMGLKCSLFLFWDMMKIYIWGGNRNSRRLCHGGPSDVRSAYSKGWCAGKNLSCIFSWPLSGLSRASQSFLCLSWASLGLLLGFSWASLGLSWASLGFSRPLSIYFAKNQFWYQTFSNFFFFQTFFQTFLQTVFQTFSSYFCVFGV